MSRRGTFILGGGLLTGLLLISLFKYRWLVLELADGRLAYVPPAAVRYIEQASSPAK